ncbi:response regulator [Deltaproteobacteria bacterium TL4]
MVDDETLVNEMRTTILEALRYKVTSFTDSQGALKAFEAKPQDFQLLITDYSMPDRTGSQLPFEFSPRAEFLNSHHVNG